MAAFEIDGTTLALGAAIFVLRRLLCSGVLSRRKHKANSKNQTPNESEPADPEPEPEDEAQTCDGGDLARPRTVWNTICIVLIIAGAVAILTSYVPALRPATQSRHVAPRSVGVATPRGLPIVPTAEDLGGQNGSLFSVTLQRQGSSISKIDGALYFKAAYYGTIHVGSPAQEYSVLFDTGSGHLLLPSRYCHSETCRAHRRYARSLSSSAVDLDYDGNVIRPTDERDQMKISFGTGYVTGVFVEDLMCQDDSVLEDMSDELIDRASDSMLRSVGCVRLRLIAATEMTESPFLSFKADGILGLGLAGVSRSAEFNYMTVLSESLSIRKMFAVFLAQSEDEDSKITFGGYEKQHLVEDLAWNDVVMPEHGHWMVAVKSLSVHGYKMDFCNDGSCRAIADSGTSLLGVPRASFAEIYTQLWHPTQLDGACKGNGPTLDIQLEHITITLEPEDYALAQLFPEPQRVDRTSTPSWGFGRFAAVADGESAKYGMTRNDMQCKPTLMSMDFPEPMGPKLFILGEPVLRKYYTVFDAADKRIGFGRANHWPNSAETALEVYEEDESWFFNDLDADDGDDE